MAGLTRPSGLKSAAPQKSLAARGGRVNVATALVVIHRVYISVITARREIARSDRHLAVSARDVEHVGRLAQARDPLPQGPYQNLPPGNGGAEMSRAWGDCSLVEGVGL